MAWCARACSVQAACKLCMRHQVQHTFSTRPRVPGASAMANSPVAACLLNPLCRPLYAGAYGTVYKALRDGVQVVAVKKFHHLDDPRQQRSIMKEVSILKGCRSVTDQKLELSCICMVMSLAGEGLSR